MSPMNESIPSTWSPAGETSNTRYFVAEERVLVGVTNPGSADDGKTARENVDFQNAWVRKQGGGVILIFIDNLVSQDKDARRVYQTGLDATVFRGCALVGGSLLSRAIGSFFLGIARPRVPIKLCKTVDDGLEWARARNREAKQEARP
jgi:hypothetical protein